MGGSGGAVGGEAKRRAAYEVQAPIAGEAAQVRGFMMHVKRFVPGLKIPGAPGGGKMKMPGGGGGGGGGGAPQAAGGAAPGGGGPAPSGAHWGQQHQTWNWPALEQEEDTGGVGKKLLLLLLLLLIAAGAAAAVWYTVIREDEKKPAAAAPVVPPGAPPSQRIVLQIEPLLIRSSQDRAKIGKAISGTLNNCAVQPNRAAADVGAVNRSRAAMIRQVRGIKAPNRETTRLLTRFEQSLVLSLAAGKQYAAWLQELVSAGGCPSDAASRASYAKAEATNRRTQASKRTFTRAYNPLARRFKRRTWTSAQI